MVIGRFWKAKPKGSESPGQFIVRLKSYFKKWIELFEVQKFFEGEESLIQKSATYGPDPARHVKSSGPRPMN